MTVYFARIGSDGPVKIGHSRDPRLRMLTLASHVPGPFCLMRTLDGGLDLERRIHRHFVKLRIYGEWFHFDPAMLTLTRKDLDPSPSGKMDYPERPTFWTKKDLRRKIADHLKNGKRT